MVEDVEEFRPEQERNSLTDGRHLADAEVSGFNSRAREKSCRQRAVFAQVLSPEGGAPIEVLVAVLARVHGLHGRNLHREIQPNIGQAGIIAFRKVTGRPEVARVMPERLQPLVIAPGTELNARANGIL